MASLEELGEFGFIDLARNFAEMRSGVLESIGDDCAVIESGDRPLVVTSDLLLEDVHFRRATTTADNLGWKLASVNLSDVAAMGAQPLYAQVSVALPPNLDETYATDLMKGMHDALTEHGAVITGGDTTASAGPLVLHMTLIGAVTDTRYLTRRGARQGDVVAVTGHPGRAAAGLHIQEHGLAYNALVLALHRPRALVPEGQWLAAQDTVHAMIDVSDGVVQDVRHIATASDLAIALDSKRLPVDPMLAEFCGQTNLDPHAFILSGGEDYELAICMAAESAETISVAFESQFGCPLTPIGRCDSGEGVTVDGSAFERGGFDHFSGG